MHTHSLARTLTCTPAPERPLRHSHTHSGACTPPAAVTDHTWLGKCLAACICSVQTRGKTGGPRPQLARACTRPHLNLQDGLLAQPDGLQVLLGDLRKQRLLTARPHAVAPVEDLLVVSQLSKGGLGALPRPDRPPLPHSLPLTGQACTGHPEPPARPCRGQAPALSVGDAPQGHGCWGHCDGGRHWALSAA